MLQVFGSGGGGEELGSLGEVRVQEKVFGGDFRDVGVSNPPVSVSEGDAEGFDDGVEVFGGIVLVVFEGWDLLCTLELLKDAEGYQGYKALSVWRMFPDLDTLRVAEAGSVLALEVEG